MELERVVIAASSDTGKEMKCGCDHKETAHKWEPGFYDVRGHFAECGIVGCPCKAFRATPVSDNCELRIAELEAERDTLTAENAALTRADVESTGMIAYQADQYRAVAAELRSLRAVVARWKRASLAPFENADNQAQLGRCTRELFRLVPSDGSWETE